MDGPKELEVFFGATGVTPKQQKWVSKLLVYQYDIFYRPGRTNSTADALSGQPTSPTETYASPNVNLSSPK
jgi:hypothetical protein